MFGLNVGSEQRGRQPAGWVLPLSHFEAGGKQPLRPPVLAFGKGRSQRLPALCLGGVTMRFLLIPWGTRNTQSGREYPLSPLRALLRVGQERGKRREGRDLRGGMTDVVDPLWIYLPIWTFKRKESGVVTIS